MRRKAYFSARAAEPITVAPLILAVWRTTEPTASAAPGYSGRVITAVLVDKATHTIVSNEPSDIIRMMNNAGAGANGSDFNPAKRPTDDSSPSW